MFQALTWGLSSCSTSSHHQMETKTVNRFLCLALLVFVGCTEEVDEPSHARITINARIHGSVPQANVSLNAISTPNATKRQCADLIDATHPSNTLSRLVSR